MWCMTEALIASQAQLSKQQRSHQLQRIKQEVLPSHALTSASPTPNRKAAALCDAIDARRRASNNSGLWRYGMVWHDLVWHHMTYRPVMRCTHDAPISHPSCTHALYVCLIPHASQSPSRPEARPVAGQDADPLAPYLEVRPLAQAALPARRACNHGAWGWVQG